MELVEQEDKLVLLASAADRKEEARLASTQRAEAEKTLQSIEDSRKARRADLDELST